FEVQGHLAKAHSLQMLMRVGHPGHDRRAMQIDDACVWAFELFGGGVRTHKDNAIAFDGDSFSVRLFVIHGVDVAVGENKIGRWRHRDRWLKAQAEHKQSQKRSYNLHGCLLTNSRRREERTTLYHSACASAPHAMHQ